MNHQPSPDSIARGHHFQTRRAQANQRTYDQLIEAARQLFDERGYEATTVRDVADAVGMSTGAVFGNFLDKAALFIDVVNTDCERLNQKMAGVDLAGTPIALAIERLVEVAREHHIDRLGLLQAAISFTWRGDLRPERRRLVGVDLIRARLVGLLRRAAEQGELVAGTDLDLVSDMLIVSYLSSYRAMVVEGLKKSEVQALQARQIAMLLRGVAVRA